jgi:hypothetical protein
MFGFFRAMPKKINHKFLIGNLGDQIFLVMIVAIKIFGDQIFGAVRNNFESYLKQLVI